MFLDKLYTVPFFISFFLRCFSFSSLRRMVMLWFCYKFILGDKLAYWRACLWAFFDWTVSSVQPNGEDRRACSYLAFFILVCAQQTDFDRRKSHGTAGNIGNSLFKKISILGGMRLPVNHVHCWLIAVFQETSTGIYVVSQLLGSDLVSFLAVCLQNWILSSLEQFYSHFDTVLYPWRRSHHISSVCIHP